MLLCRRGGRCAQCSHSRCRNSVESRRRSSSGGSEVVYIVIMVLAALPLLLLPLLLLLTLAPGKCFSGAAPAAAFVAVVLVLSL